MPVSQTRTVLGSRTALVNGERGVVLRPTFCCGSLVLQSNPLNRRNAFANWQHRSPTLN